MGAESGQPVGIHGLKVTARIDADMSKEEKEQIPPRGGSRCPVRTTSTASPR